MQKRSHILTPSNYKADFEKVMGKKFAEAWAEVEGDFTPAFEEAYKTGKSFVIDDARFYIERHGYLEETYYSISIIPFLVDGDEIALCVALHAANWRFEHLPSLQVTDVLLVTTLFSIRQDNLLLTEGWPSSFV